MLSIAPLSSTDRLDTRKEFRINRDDDARVKAAAAAVGMEESDFMRQGALRLAQEVERRSTKSILTTEAFKAFAAALNAPVRDLPGLQHATEASKGLLVDDA